MCSLLVSVKDVCAILVNVLVLCCRVRYKEKQLHLSQ